MNPENGAMIYTEPFGKAKVESNTNIVNNVQATVYIDGITVRNETKTVINMVEKNAVISNTTTVGLGANGIFIQTNTENGETQYSGGVKGKLETPGRILGSSIYIGGQIGVKPK
tara:strand:+ start:471 stop:812 length:342 start_codon:yes stop_codon:yes gene_type:complete